MRVVGVLALLFVSIADAAVPQLVLYDDTLRNGFNNGTEIGLKAQNQRNPLINEFSDIDYTNVSMIPTPGAASLLALGGLFAGRRRR